MVILNQVRCPVCNKRLFDIEKGYAQIKCPKCKSLIAVNMDDRKITVLSKK